MRELVTSRRYNQNYLAKKELSTEEYMVYKNDDFQMIGTAKECADFLGVKVNTFFMYQTKSRQEQFSKLKKHSKLYKLEITKLEEDEYDEN